MSIPGANYISPIRQTNNETISYAHILFQQLTQEIEAFDKKLDDDYETVFHLASFNGTFNITVTQVAYKDPGLLIFKGTDNDGSEIELLQNASQFSFALVKQKRPDPTLPKQPIGFVTS